MRKQRDTETATTWNILNTRRKVAVIAIAGVFVAGLIFFTFYRYHQHQQALVLAEQQEQERLVAEQAETERIAAEAQASLEREAERLAADEEAARLAAEQIEQERIAAEEEQSRLEEEAQAETERVAAEESAAEQARQQAEAAEQQQSTANQIVGNENTRTDTSSGTTSSDPREEPTSGVGRERADRVGGVWDPDQGGWVYVTETGERVLIRPNGASRSLDSPIALN